MPKSRILIFIDWFLPGYKAGGPIQSCANMVEHLQDEYDFWVITRDTDYCETSAYSTIKSDTWNELAPHLQVFYCSGKNLKFNTLRNAAVEAQPDVIFINGIYSIYFSVFPLRIAKLIGCKQKIVSARGMLAHSAIQVKGAKKKLFLQFSKLLGFYMGVRFHATNEAEQVQIRQTFGPIQEIVIAPNLPKPLNGQLSKANSKNSDQLKLVSIARIAPEKNTLYAIELLTQSKTNAHINLDLYGPIYDAAYWEDCKKLIRLLPGNIQITYRGSIANSMVHETLQQYHALLLPTRGENFGHVILESFAAGLPVIISDQTPWRNLEQENVGFDLPLSNPDHFVKAILKFAAMPVEEYRKTSEAAYIYATSFISDPTAVAQNRKLFSFNT